MRVGSDSRMCAAPVLGGRWRDWRRSLGNSGLLGIYPVGQKLIYVPAATTSVSLTGLTGGFDDRPGAGDAVLVAVAACRGFTGAIDNVSGYDERVEASGGDFDRSAL